MATVRIFLHSWRNTNAKWASATLPRQSQTCQWIKCNGSKSVSSTSPVLVCCFHVQTRKREGTKQTWKMELFSKAAPGSIADFGMTCQFLTERRPVHTASVRCNIVLNATIYCSDCLTAQNIFNCKNMSSPLKVLVSSFKRIDQSSCKNLQRWLYIWIFRH